MTDRCSTLIVKPDTLLQFLVKLALRGILQDEIDACFIVEIAVHAQDVWMPETYPIYIVLGLGRYQNCHRYLTPISLFAVTP